MPPLLDEPAADTLLVVLESPRLPGGVPTSVDVSQFRKALGRAGVRIKILSRDLLVKRCEHGWAMEAVCYRDWRS